MEELSRTIIEEYEGGIEELRKNRYKNSTILLSKALFAVCDLIIYYKLKRLPKNHGERFKILHNDFPEIYAVVDLLFAHYTDAYSKPILRETCEDIKNGITQIVRTNRVPKEIKALLEQEHN